MYSKRLVIRITHRQGLELVEESLKLLYLYLVWAWDHCKSTKVPFMKESWMWQLDKLWTNCGQIGKSMDKLTCTWEQWNRQHTLKLVSLLPPSGSQQWANFRSMPSCCMLTWSKTKRTWVSCEELWVNNKLNYQTSSNIMSFHSLCIPEPTSGT